MRSLISRVTSSAGLEASTTRYRDGSARASARNPARTRRWNSGGSASSRSADRVRRPSPASGGMSSRIVRSGIRPPVAQLFSFAISAVAQAPAGALVGQRRVDVPVGDDDRAAGQGRAR